MIVGGFAARHALMARASRRAAMSAIERASAAGSAPCDAGTMSWASGTRAGALDAATATTAPAMAIVRPIWMVAMRMAAGSRTGVQVP